MSAEPRSYYGQPILKAPVWTPEIPTYFYAGGLAGASAGLAFLADLRGNDELARKAWIAALGGIGASPPLLISDLGRPERFLNMLRMFKVTSPMSVGSWVLAVSGAATTVAAADALTGRWPVAGRLAGGVAALFGLPLATYTAALVANTSIPVWHDARRELPFVFAGGAAASAGAMACAFVSPEAAGPARRLAVGGAVVEIAAATVMERRLGDVVGAPYHSGPAGRLARASLACTAAGAGLVVAGGRRRRALTLAGAGLLSAGALCERWAVYRAGFQSAADPAATVGPQRERMAAGGGE